MEGDTELGFMVLEAVEGKDEGVAEVKVVGEDETWAACCM